MEDCMHLKACRRLCKIGKIHGRGCNEFCTAYEKKCENKEYIIDECINALYSIQEGYSVDDYAWRIKELLNQIR